MKRALTLPLALASALLLAAVGPVQAAPPQQVDLYGCLVFTDGQATVDHDRDVYIRFGWATNNWRQLRQFLNVASIVVKVDGVKIPHPNARWNLPAYQEEAQYWLVWWSARLPRFAQGESRTVTLQVWFEKRHFDGTDYYGPGKLYDPRLSCTITAA